MKLNTCTGCKFSPAECDHALHLREHLKGTGIRSVKFACAKRVEVFSGGQAAIFTTYIADADDEYSNYRITVSYPGYVIKQVGSKVLGFIKPMTPDTSGEYPFDARGNGYVKMPLSRVHADAERPSVSLHLCTWCASYFEIDGRCERDPNYTRPESCRAAMAKMEAAQ